MVTREMITKGAKPSKIWSHRFKTASLQYKAEQTWMNKHRGTKTFMMRRPFPWMAGPPQLNNKEIRLSYIPDYHYQLYR